jgi:hypothetical protein
MGVLVRLVIQGLLVQLARKAFEVKQDVVVLQDRKVRLVNVDRSV